MNRLRETIRNVIVFVILVVIFLLTTGNRLTPISAHEFSERSIHYGPSEVVEVFDYGSYQHILCKYDRWVSCNTVKRQLMLFWSPGSQVTGFENEVDKPFDYSGSLSYGVIMIYGIVNDPAIVKMELYNSDELILTQEAFYDDLFYFTWEDESVPWGTEKLIGYDSDGNVVYEAENP